jgi:hypothetical protein
MSVMKQTAKKSIDGKSPRKPLSLKAARAPSPVASEIDDADDDVFDEQDLVQPHVVSNSTASSTVQSLPHIRPSGTNVLKACMVCQMRKTKCSNQRPCNACKAKGWHEFCFDDSDSK